MECQECTTPTKHVVGLWDGANGTYGQIYDCHNIYCKIKQDKLGIDKNLEEEKAKVEQTNNSNGIYMWLYKAKRKELLITLNKMAKELGISPSQYSNYEQYRVVLPVEMVDKINEVFREEMRKSKQ